MKGKPEAESWWCERCRELINLKSGTDIKCIMDEDLTGAIVKTNIGWVHISCVNWISEIWFTNAEKTNVYGQLLESRKEYTSTYTGKKGQTCITCDYSNCINAFTIREAMKNGLIRGDMTDNRETEESHEAYIFCENHRNDGKNVLKRFGVGGLKTRET